MSLYNLFISCVRRNSMLSAFLIGFVQVLQHTHITFSWTFTYLIYRLCYDWHTLGMIDGCWWWLELTETSPSWSWKAGQQKKTWYLTVRHLTSRLITKVNILILCTHLPRQVRRDVSLAHTHTHTHTNSRHRHVLCNYKNTSNWIELKLAVCNEKCN